MIVYPNAKINIGLNIVRKREDGFHDIESIFYPVNWSDELKIEKAASLKFTSSGIDIPGDANDNLCVKAYELIKADHSIEPVNIHLDKRIPIGAGLGGGSADASYTLKALNELFDLNLTDDQLISYAKQLGSDCAFFIKNESMFCYGKGDEFDSIQFSLSCFKIVLVNPGIHIGTAEAYAGVQPKSPNQLIKSINDCRQDEWKTWLHNDFEDSIFPNHSSIKELKDRMYELGATYAAMTGSGSTVFGLFYKDLEIDFESHFKDYQMFIHE